MFEKEVFAQRLASLIKQSKKSHSDVATAVGVSRGAISQYCNGFSVPSVEVLVALSNYFKVPLDYLTGTGIYKYWDMPEVVDAIRELLLESYDSLGITGISKDAFEAVVLDNPISLALFAQVIFSQIEVERTDPIKVTVYPRLDLSAMHEE